MIVARRALRMASNRQPPVRSAWLSPVEADRLRAAKESAKPGAVNKAAASTSMTTAPPPPKIEDPDKKYDYLIDIGINLAHKRFSHDLAEVIQRAMDAKVEKQIITGTSIGASRRAVEIAKIAPGVLYSTAGVHPHDAKTWNPRSAGDIRKLVASNPGIVKAIGECGLDYDRNFSTPEDQVRAFREQLDLACELKLPVFLHERSAFKEFLEILKEYRPRLTGAVVHCFTGTEEELDAYLALDVHIGITGWVCDPRRGLDLLRLTRKIPLDRLMIETCVPERQAWPFTDA